MTHPDRANLERVVPGPEYPEVKVPYLGDSPTYYPERSGAVVVWIAAVLVIVAFVLIVVAAASRPPGDQRSTGSAAPAVGGSSAASLVPGAPHDAGRLDTGNGNQDGPPRGVRVASVPSPSGAPPTVDRYRGTATWYCLSGSSACTTGYGPDDLVAAIDTDLGFAKGDDVTVRYRDRSVTVLVVDVCGCPGRRLIDLTSGAFSRLAPLGHGVIPVTIELAGGPTLPPTDGGTP